MLLLMMLLGHSISWSQSSNDSISTGSLMSADTTIEVPINVIRIVNNKLIERKYYINIADSQDSIIDLQKGYIKEQKYIIEDLQSRILESNKINENIRNECERQKRKEIIFGGLAGTFATTTIVAVLICIFKN